jgi:hypothetical protein
MNKVTTSTERVSESLFKSLLMSGVAGAIIEEAKGLETLAC